MTYISSYTTPGIRPENEDAIYPPPGSPESAFLIVADGLGGHEDGKLASRLACERVTEILTQEDPYSFVVGGRRMTEENLYLNFLGDAVRLARDRVAEKAGQLNSNMATTLLVVLLQGSCGYAAHVGDCALYLVNATEKTARKLTQEHRRGKNLTNVLGQSEGGIPDLFRFDFSPDSALIMGTDGFWESLSPGEIAKILQVTPPFAVSEALTRAALQADSLDNVSVVAAVGEEFTRRNAARQLHEYSRFLNGSNLPGKDILRQQLVEFARQYIDQIEVRRWLRSAGLLVEPEAATEPTGITEKTGVHIVTTPDSNGIEQKLAQLQREIAQLKGDNTNLLVDNRTKAHELEALAGDISKREHEVEDLRARLRAEQNDLMMYKQFLTGVLLDIHAVFRRYPNEVSTVLGQEHMKLLNEKATAMNLLSQRGPSSQRTTNGSER